MHRPLLAPSLVMWVVAVAFSMSACNNLRSLTPMPVGLTAELKLQPCPDAPHCVSSDEARAGYAIAPLEIVGEANGYWQRLRAHVSSLPRASVISENDGYLHLQFTTRWMSYTDDVEFHLRPEQRIVAMRSCSRLGYYDFNVNRERLEEIRAAFR